MGPSGLQTYLVVICLVSKYVVGMQVLKSWQNPHIGFLLRKVKVISQASQVETSLIGQDTKLNNIVSQEKWQKLISLLKDTGMVFPREILFNSPVLGVLVV